MYSTLKTAQKECVMKNWKELGVLEFLCKALFFGIAFVFIASAFVNAQTIQNDVFWKTVDGKNRELYAILPK